MCEEINEVRKVVHLQSSLMQTKYRRRKMADHTIMYAKLWGFTWTHKCTTWGKSFSFIILLAAQLLHETWLNLEQDVVCQNSYRCLSQNTTARQQGGKPHTNMHLFFRKRYLRLERILLNKVLTLLYLFIELTLHKYFTAFCNSTKTKGWIYSGYKTMKYCFYNFIT